MVSPGSVSSYKLGSSVQFLPYRDQSYCKVSLHHSDDHVKVIQYLYLLTLFKAMNDL